MRLARSKSSVGFPRVRGRVFHVERTKAKVLRGGLLQQMDFLPASAEKFAARKCCRRCNLCTFIRFCTSARRWDRS